MSKVPNSLSSIPQVEKLLTHPLLEDSIKTLGRSLVAELVSSFLDEVRREAVKGGSIPVLDVCAERVKELCLDFARRRINRVINATGVVLHTNLGRSPLPEGVWEAAKEVGQSYSSIEMNLFDGKRGGRFEFLRSCMSRLVGSEDSLILNNNAASVYLLLRSLAEGKEVIVARGQQVQIGGGFRIPEILQLAGCKLVEVGTTNITTVQDIKNAITENTAAVLWVHTSNYKIRGFTEEPALHDIKKVLPSNVILAVDQGSGNLFFNIPEEPAVKFLLKEGADLVCFSGDKLLGGPQAGWIAGAEKYISKIAAHQLMRTYRVGRAVAALMEETLVYYLNAGLPAAMKAVETPPEVIKRRSLKLISKLPEKSCELIESPFSLGGGTAPDMLFPSWAVRLISTKSAEKIKTALRKMPVPVIVFICEDKIFVHLIAVNEADDEYTAECLNKVLR